MYILIVLIPGMILSGLASWYVRSAYSKYSKTGNYDGITGAEVARQLMNRYNIPMPLQETPGEMSDHFDPGNKVVRLSPGVYHKPTVAAMAIAAHEFGHVQQYAENSPMIAVRSYILPAAQFGSSAAPWLIIGGLLLQFQPLAILGLLAFAAAVLFSVITLPVELDASRRALKMLDGAGLLNHQADRHGARVMLRAAAFTYLAAMIVALLNLAYYAMLVLGRNRD